MSELKVKDYTLKTTEGDFLITVEYDGGDFNPRTNFDGNAGTMLCWHSRYQLGDEHNFSKPREFLNDSILNLPNYENLLEPYFKKLLGLSVRKNVDGLFELVDVNDKIWSTSEDENKAAELLDNEKDVFFNDSWTDHLTAGDKLTILKENGFVILPLFIYDHSGITMNTRGFNCVWDSGPVGWIYTTITEYHEEIKAGATLEEIEEDLKTDVATYNQYLCGDIYYVKAEKITLCNSCNHTHLEHYDSAGGIFGMDGVRDVFCEMFEKKYHDEIKENI